MSDTRSVKTYAVIRAEGLEADPYVAIAEEGLRDDSRDWKAEKRGLTLVDAEELADGLNTAAAVMES